MKKKKKLKLALTNAINQKLILEEHALYLESCLLQQTSIATSNKVEIDKLNVILRLKIKIILEHYCIASFVTELLPVVFDNTIDAEQVKFMLNKHSKCIFLKKYQLF